MINFRSGFDTFSNGVLHYEPFQYTMKSDILGKQVNISPHRTGQDTPVCVGDRLVLWPGGVPGHHVVGHAEAQDDLVVTWVLGRARLGVQLQLLQQQLLIHLLLLVCLFLLLPQS